MTYTNSSLVSYINITSHKRSPQNQAIDRITPHCIVGQTSAQWCVDYFETTDREASSNYVIGKNGEVGLSVEEKDRSWCSSSPENDNRAVTIECASDKFSKTLSS
ncbi:MAG: N-acetylmuramoyl-L-alanine amidase [Bacillota bacterium]|nr:N-acetylmuramoyl-L-alanine amidase [Bacillota bacterium]